MKDRWILFFAFGIALVILFSIALILTEDNTGVVAGTECIRNFRLDTDVPFCSAVTECVHDCTVIDGGFVKVTRHGGGFSGGEACFCLTQNGVQNIW